MNSGNNSKASEEQMTPESLKSYYDSLWQHGAYVLNLLTTENTNLRQALTGQEQYYSQRFVELERKHAAEIAALKEEHKQDIHGRFAVTSLTQKLEVSQMLLKRSLTELQVAQERIEILKTNHRRELHRVTQSPTQSPSQNTPFSTNINILYPSPRFQGNLGGELSDSTSTYYLRNNLSRRKGK